MAAFYRDLSRAEGMSVSPVKEHSHSPVNLIYLNGSGWDYDRLLCGIPGCNWEYEFDFSTEPDEPQEPNWLFKG